MKPNYSNISGQIPAMLAAVIVPTLHAVAESPAFEIDFESRLRGEIIKNPNFGVAPDDLDERLLTRAMLGVSYDQTGTSIYAQIHHGHLMGNSLPARPPDRTGVDFHQIYFDQDIADSGFGFRLGRQEIGLGSARLVSTRNGPNLRLSFDAARVTFQDAVHRLDAFFAQPVDTITGAFNNSSSSDERLWGLYYTAKFSESSNIGVDAYYLGFSDDRAVYGGVLGREERHSFGTRFFGESDGWDWNLEPTLQIGSFGDRDILAWALETDTGYTFRQFPWTPRIGLKVNLISGDRNGGTGTLGTFNTMYPRGSYFGEAGFVGPANLLHYDLGLRLTPNKAFTIDSSIGLFHRHSKSDGVYNMARREAFPSIPGASREIGTQVMLECNWRATEHMSFTANATHFFAGDFMEQSGASSDETFFMLSTTLKF